MKALVLAALTVIVLGEAASNDFFLDREVGNIFKENAFQNKFGTDEISAPTPDINNRASNPCELYGNSKPANFTAPGRRISVAKCYEYIYMIKTYDDDATNLRLCGEYREKHPDYRGGPYFAIGGHSTLPGEYPHMAAVGWKAATGTWIFKCGGTLISENFVLTAAHCTRTSSLDNTVADPVPKIVRLGDKNIADVAVNRIYPNDKDIAKIIVHPSYKAPRKYYDIALLKLDGPTFFNQFILPACLWTKPDTSSLGTEATLTGWGVTETGGRTTSPELQAAEVDVITASVCDSLLKPSCNRHWCGVDSHQICAGKLAGGVDACQGDSGGPLQVKINLPVKDQGQLSFVIGVTSFGIGCARANTPGVYTRVSSFIDWIEQNVWLSTNA